jgi:hypothetical protein
MYCISCCHASPSILLFISLDRISHLMPFLLSGWLLTDVQVNNITTPRDSHRYITSALIFFFFLHFFHPSWQAGWSRPFPSDKVTPYQTSIHKWVFTYKILPSSFAGWQIENVEETVTVLFSGRTTTFLSIVQKVPQTLDASRWCSQNMGWFSYCWD